MHKKRKTAAFSIRRVAGAAQTRHKDVLVVEEPLTILWQAAGGAAQRLSATMRTPGEDNELAAGLLFSEGLLLARGELEGLSFCASGGVNELNRMTASLRLTPLEAEGRLARRPSHGIPQSSCGLCAFDELSNPGALLKWAASGRPEETSPLRPDAKLITTALHLLEGSSPVFRATGASHAVVVVSAQGTLLAAAEDVGRHNACDKAIGSLLLGQRCKTESFRLPEGAGLLFSSRLSFELAAKAVRAGAAWMGSLGAPTHLAVELAKICSLPTYGFLTADRHNIYVE